MAYSTSRLASALVLLTLTGAASYALADDQYSPPPSYYAGISGTGTSLEAQLRSAMSAGHIQSSYGDIRYSSAIHDQDPDDPSHILLVYNRASVSGSWDSGSTWNREHVWPQSRQPGDASNSTRGNLGDPHSVLPANPSINSSRGNKPYGGGAETTGGYRSLGAFYFPGDADKGDIARSLFYSDTRYGSASMTLVEGSPSGNQMGDLASLIAWNYLDVPDTFERRRNHAIYSAELNPVYYTNNRNAYVDHPEFVWSVFVDQMNDSTIWLGDLEPADGASSIDLDLGNLVVGDLIDPMSFTLNKSGNAGTYYSVTAGEGLLSSISGPLNAFAMSDTNLTQTINLAVDPAVTADAGVFMSELRIDNLDVTTQGGAGNGANDIDDIIFVAASIFNPGNGSFDSGSDQDQLQLDLGTISMGGGDFSQSFSFFNLAVGGELGAPIDIELVSGTGDTSALSTSFAPINALSPIDSASFEATLDDDQADGAYSATYTFRVYNARSMFAGSEGVEDLVLVLTGEIGGGVCAADFAEPYGQLNFFDVSAFLSAFSSGDLSADLTGEGQLNFFDVSEFLSVYGAGCP